MKKIIYFDNNATTKPCHNSILETTKWLEKGANPSSNNPLAILSKKMINNAKKYILEHCKTNINQYSIIFTSGGSEANSFIVRSTTMAYYNIKKIKPHIIISSIEHHSLLDCCKSLEKNKCVELTLIKPNIFGLIDPEKVKDHIKNNTCLISIMHVNNEIGSINDIKKIGEIAHSHNIPFHTDNVQGFGKRILNIKEMNIDAMSVSFHKFYCPLGLGMLIINNDLIEGYKLESIINGTQQNGLRGGTENVPCIAGSISGMKYNFKSRETKNKKLLLYRNTFLDKLNKEIEIIYYDTYLYDTNYQNKDLFIILFGAHRNMKESYIENTILISIVSNKDKFCNMKFKKDLEHLNIIVSISSACSTDIKEASHVINSLNVNDVVKRGVIRISFGDYNTINEIKQSIPLFLKAISKQVKI